MAGIGKVTVGNRHRGDVGTYIGRPSIYGNPFTSREGTKAKFLVATSEEAIASYAEWLAHDPCDEAAAARAGVETLAVYVAMGHDLTLVCTCAPKSCHGDVLQDRIVRRAREHVEGNL